MKVTVIWSSPNKEGLTASAKKTILLKEMEKSLVHMNMRAYDRIPVNRYNSEYILPALIKAGETYADKLENGFDMYY